MTTGVQLKNPYTRQAVTSDDMERVAAEAQQRWEAHVRNVQADTTLPDKLRQILLDPETIYSHEQAELAGVNRQRVLSLRMHSGRDRHPCAAPAPFTLTDGETRRHQPGMPRGYWIMWLIQSERVQWDPQTDQLVFPETKPLAGRAPGVGPRRRRRRDS